MHRDIWNWLGKKNGARSQLVKTLRLDEESEEEFLLRHNDKKESHKSEDTLRLEVEETDKQGARLGQTKPAWTKNEARTVMWMESGKQG